MRWDHPNLVRIYGVDDDKKAGRLYILIEFVGSSSTTSGAIINTGGGSLGDRLGTSVSECMMDGMQWKR